MTMTFGAGPAVNAPRQAVKTPLRSPSRIRSTISTSRPGRDVGQRTQWSGSRQRLARAQVDRNLRWKRSAELAHQSRLAGAGLAAHEDQATLAGGGFRQPRPQGPQLSFVRSTPLRWSLGSVRAPSSRARLVEVGVEDGDPGDGIDRPDR